MPGWINVEFNPGTHLEICQCGVGEEIEAICNFIFKNYVTEIML
jgi:hypothetical protein